MPQQEQQAPGQPNSAFGGLGHSLADLGQLNDFYSQQQQNLLHQQMLAQRDQAFTPTLNPGQSWGGLDANAMRPDDVMADRYAAYLRQERL